MKIFRTKGQFLKYRRALPRETTVGFVATMGYLHKGHEALIRKSARENTHTIVSIFVNPTQFAPHEDFATYPRDLARDLRMIETSGADSVFIPREIDIYPGGRNVSVDHPVLTQKYDGITRPHFFSGGMTVVAKFFNIVQPHRAYFGKKDYQQLYLFHQLARELAFPVKVCSIPTAREKNGLACSTRNAYLASDAEFDQAAQLYAILTRTKKHAFNPKTPTTPGKPSTRRSATKVLKFFKTNLAKCTFFKLDYVVLIDRATLLETPIAVKGKCVILAAVFFIDLSTRKTQVRLIDNIEL